MITHTPSYAAVSRLFGGNLQTKIEAWAVAHPSATGKVSYEGAFGGGAGTGFWNVGEWARNMMMGGFHYQGRTTATVTTSCNNNGKIRITADYTVSWKVEKWYKFACISGDVSPNGNPTIGYKTAPQDFLMRVFWEGDKHHAHWTYTPKN
jgi:hypothetical protein